MAHRFPEGFLWGGATAANQCEGDVGAGAHEGAGDDGGDNDVDKAIDKLFPATK